MKTNLLSVEWWKAAVVRALRTALVIVVPYVPMVLEENLALVALSAAGFGFITSILTSLFGIPEADGSTVFWGYALFERVVKTAAQALVTAFGTATVFAEIDWNMVWPAVVTAVIGSLLLGVLKSLPETEEAKAKAAAKVEAAN